MDDCKIYWDLLFDSSDVQSIDILFVFMLSIIGLEQAY